MGLITEFKNFAMRGNVIDMAVGIVIGAAFKDIVTSLVSNIITPPIALLGQMPFKHWSITLREAANPEDNIAITYGQFLDTVVSFAIVALAIFIVVKAANKAHDLIDGEDEDDDKEPTTKKCEYCQSEIAIAATRCPCCTSHIAGETA